MNRFHLEEVTSFLRVHWLYLIKHKNITKTNTLKIIICVYGTTIPIPRVLLWTSQPNKEKVQKIGN